MLAAASLAVPLAAGVGMGNGGDGDGGDETADGPHSLREQSKVLLAAALLLLWSAQTLRLLSMLPDVGPLVLMFFKMLRDVVLWLVLVGALVLAFAASFHTIFKVRAHARTHAPPSSSTCVIETQSRNLAITQSRPPPAGDAPAW